MLLFTNLYVDCYGWNSSLACNAHISPYCLLNAIARPVIVPDLCAKFPFELQGLKVKNKKEEELQINFLHTSLITIGKHVLLPCSGEICGVSLKLKVKRESMARDLRHPYTEYYRACHCTRTLPYVSTRTLPKSRPAKPTDGDKHC